MDGDSKPRPAVEEGSAAAEEEEEPTEAAPSPAHTATPGGARDQTVAAATGEEPPRAPVDNDDDVVLVEEEAPPPPPPPPPPGRRPSLAATPPESGPAPPTAATETADAATTTTTPQAPAEPIVIDDEEDRDSASTDALSSTEPDSHIRIASVTTLGPAPVAVATTATAEPEGGMNLMITSVTSLQGGGAAADEEEGAEPSGLQISGSFSLSAEASVARATPTFNPGRAAAQLLHNGETGTHQRPDSWISQSASFPRNQKQPAVDTPSPAAPPAKPPAPPPPQAPPPAGSAPRTVKVTCANCKKPLRKGQTAYQRKGSTHLFCSTTCLSAFSHKPAPKKSCTMCKKDITAMKGTIVAQVDSSEAFQEFCSTGCLGAYENKQNPQNPPKSSIKTKCTVCGKLTEIRHEVSFKNVTHKICSDACFNRYRMTNGLIMNCCEQCGDYLPSRASANHFLSVDGQNKRFCCQNCVRDFKQAHGKMATCSSCKTLMKTGEVTHGIGASGTMETYCSSACMSKSKMAAVTTVINPEPTCHFCKRTSLPQYQATLPEGNILNFCSSTCVTKFQNAPVQTASNGPAPLSTNHSVQLKCDYCRAAFSLPPETLEWEDKVHQFCSKACCEDYKKLHCIVTFCHNCQEEKTLHETVQFSGVKRPFCSEGCKLLFKQDFAKRLGLKCVTCNHCTQLCKRGVTRQLGGVTRDFCSETCAKRFHDWYHKAARCDCCKVQGNLTESVQWRAEMKHFCDQNCLLRFYCQQNQPNLVTQKGPENTSLEIGLQTQGTKLAVLGQGPGSYAGGGVKDVKNKAVLCKPLTLTKATYCKPHMQSKHLQTDVDDGVKREYIPVPIPVPVFIPVPMNLYAQVTPAPLALPVPVPVPVFLPTTLQGAEQIVQTLRELKTKAPRDPLEEELLAMARVMAEEQKPDVKCMKVKMERGEDRGRSSSSSISSWDDEDEDEEEDKYEPELDLEKDVPQGPVLEDMETDSAPPPVLVQEEADAPRPRPRPRRLGLKRRAVEATPPSSPPPPSPAPPPPPARARSLSLKARYGVNAWRRWALSSLHQSADTNGKDSPKPETASGVPRLALCVPPETPSWGRGSLLSLSAAELGHALARFVCEVRRPNGDRYAPDSVLYLCLGIQQHLQAKGRKDDLFSDPSYQRFGEELNKVIRDWRPSVLPDGSLWGRVEEPALWGCRLLGDQSPAVLLRSLVYLNTKYLGLRTVDQHLRMSFTAVYGPDRTGPRTQDTDACFCLPVLPQDHSLPPGPDPTRPGSAKRRRTEEPDGDPELHPDDGSGAAAARRPVQKHEARLYELYRSKCPESLRRRTDVLYVQPEASSNPDSPLWFSSAPLDRRVLELLLPRCLLVTDVYRGARPLDQGEGEGEEQGEEPGEGEEEEREEEEEEQGEEPGEEPGEGEEEEREEEQMEEQMEEEQEGEEQEGPGEEQEREEEREGEGEGEQGEEEEEGPGEEQEQGKEDGRL